MVACPHCFEIFTNLDQTFGLYVCQSIVREIRSLSEVVRQLDDIRGRSKTISDLFLPSLATLRIRLHDLCHKLILTDPLGYGKKGEELLWKKGYHDVFTTAKRLRKNDKWSPQEAGFVQGLLISGVGHYQHLLFKLQSDYKVDMQGLIDFPISISDLGLSKVKTSQQKLSDKNVEEWARDSCHRCLVYLGDLSRYLLDIFPLWDGGTAERYYLQAANLNISCGRPFNQLGTLSGNKNYNLDAVYHYIRCVIRPDPFEGAEANLRKALDKNIELARLDSMLSNPVPPLKKLISKFLYLFDILYFEKSMNHNVNDLCEELLHEFQFCLNEENENSFVLDTNELELSNLTPFRDRILCQPNGINCDMVLKIVVLTLLCFEKLSKKDSQNVSYVIALSMELFSQLLQKLITHFRKFYLESGINEKNFESYENGSGQKEFNDCQADRNSSCMYVGHNKLDEVFVYDKCNGYSVAESERNIKYSVKKKYNKDYTVDSNDTDCLLIEDLDITEAEDSKYKTRKKSKLKRRKRVRPDSLCESEISDSDVTLNDSSSGNDFSCGDSESDGVISSDSEDLDETLQIIDQKIKEKNNKDNINCEINGIIKNEFFNTNYENLKNGNIEKHVSDGITINEIVLSNDKNRDNYGLKMFDNDKTKSVFTILNGGEDHMEVKENSVGDIVHENMLTLVDSVSSHTIPLISRIKESKEHGDFSAEGKKGYTTSVYCPKYIDTGEFTRFLLRQDFLKAVKIFGDWLLSKTDILKNFSKSRREVLNELVTFLNLIKFGIDSIFKDYRGDVIHIPLSEDISLRGLPMLHQCHEKLDWEFHKTHNITNKEEVLIRLRKLLEFGHNLVKTEEAVIMYDKIDNLFHIVRQNGMQNTLEIAHEKPVNNISSNTNNNKGQLMKNMGQLWLKAEVRDLESRVRKKTGNFSPYLVIDCEALIEHIVLVKQLVGSRQFIVIIPTVVLSHLDECKRESGRARETIRWLESQFQHGNRSLRAQKSQERFSLPLIKYPKKKDKEAWNFFQIVECCHYFSKQSEFQSCRSNLLVTLLTGQKDIVFAADSKKEDFGKDYSPVGVAKNFGINLEYIEAFHTKWKLSTKSHG